MATHEDLCVLIKFTPCHISFIFLVSGSIQIWLALSRKNQSLLKMPIWLERVLSIEEES